MRLEPERRHLARICKLAYDRKFLDSAGGNVTTRHGDLILMTRSYAGGRRQWELAPEEILVLNRDGEILEGRGEFSREGAVHMECYRRLPLAGCVFHAHSLNIMPFVCARVPIPPMSEQTDKFGDIGFCEWAPTHTRELALNVTAALAPAADRLTGHPIATLIPRHGIFVVGVDLDTTYDALERIDRNAYIALMSGLLPPRGK